MFILKNKVAKWIKKTIENIKNRDDKQVISFFLIVLIAENIWHYVNNFSIEIFTSIIKYLIAYPLYMAYITIGKLKGELAELNSLKQKLAILEENQKQDKIKHEAKIRSVNIKINELKLSSQRTKERVFLELGKQDIIIEKVQKKSKDIALIKLLVEENIEKIINIEKEVEKLK